MTDAPKIVFFDIESSPMRGLAWRRYDTDLLAIEDDWHLLSIAWKWQGEKRVQTQTTQGHPSDDRQLAQTLHDLFDEADVVVGHNSDKFDIIKANARMVFWKIPPPSSYRTVDTLKVARRHFAFSSNSLDDLCNHLGLGRKVRHPGLPMWRACMADDPKAFARMARYNAHDIVLLERLYNRLLSWDTNHPNLALMAGKPEACPKCLAPASKLYVHGYRHYKVTSKVQYQCTVCRSIVYGRAMVRSEIQYVP